MPVLRVVIQSKIATMAIQMECAMIAITTIMDAKILALIAGGLIVIGMKSAIHQVLSLGTIMLNVRKSALNMARTKTKD